MLFANGAFVFLVDILVQYILAKIPLEFNLCYLLFAL